MIDAVPSPKRKDVSCVSHGVSHHPKAARREAVTMEAVPSPSTSPLATITIIRLWLRPSVHRHACARQQNSNSKSISCLLKKELKAMLAAFGLL